MTALPTEFVLLQEAIAIQPDREEEIAALPGGAHLTEPEPRPETAAGDAPSRGLKLGVAAEGQSTCADEQDRQQRLYRGLNGLDRAALCLSGGGIRSAAFSLGVIQALATHPRPNKLRGALEFVPQRKSSGDKPAAASASAKGEAAAAAAVAQPDKDPANTVSKARDSLLAGFHFLSTVSGGGYIGSWLSAWRHWSTFDVVWANLVGRPCGPDIEPGTLAWLRSYSNYLTPKLGLASADTWAGVAIAVRNLVLTWLVIIPVILLVLLLLKITALVAVGVARLPEERNWTIASAVVGIVLLIVAQRFITRNRPTRSGELDGVADGEPRGPEQFAYLWQSLLPSLLSAIALTQFVASNRGLAIVDHHSKLLVILIGAVAGLIVFALGWLAGWPRNWSLGDLVRWSLSGAVYGALVGAAAYFYNLAPTDGLWLFNDLLLAVLFGVPWILFSQLMAEMVFVGLTSYEANSDTDREWLGRSAGWVMAVAIGWFLTTFFTMAGSLLVADLVGRARSSVTAAGGVSAVVTALVGKSRFSPGRGKPDAQSTWPIATNLILAIAAPVFAASLIALLSAALDELLFDESLVTLMRLPDMVFGRNAWWITLGWLWVAVVIVVAIAAAASRNINVNRFSLHAVYRNRLVRAFLGASNPKRSANAFTGFEPRDNVRMHELWPAKDGERRLFHVVNMALNIVSSKRLSWQERKAECFTVSPLHSGSACKAYRRSDEYAGNKGITLGTAMAISGAAASPNMGYHSSPPVTFLLALFNVRLGWWLGNPGREGHSTYKNEGPDFAIWPLLQEAFGLTTDDRKYVYLSDGGHFENLGLYEMVRRRCRFIICVDASADANYGFEDLGNAVRKIQLDLGVAVRFRGISLLKPRPVSETGEIAPYHAIGEINYPAADGGGKVGYVLYIKPGYHGVENAGVRAYANANDKFPHESTGDQFFSESQFESYRSLGFDIADHLLDEVFRKNPQVRANPTLEGILVEIASWREAHHAAPHPERRTTP